MSNEKTSGVALADVDDLCSRCGGIAGASIPAEPVFHGFGPPAPCVCATALLHDRPMPTPEEFIRFLVEGRSDTKKAWHAHSRLVAIYAATYANLMGEAPRKVESAAAKVLSDFRASAEERWADAQ